MFSVFFEKFHVFRFKTRSVVHIMLVHMVEVKVLSFFFQLNVQLFQDHLRTN